jgi:hypothetical protein
VEKPPVVSTNKQTKEKSCTAKGRKYRSLSRRQSLAGAHCSVKLSIIWLFFSLLFLSQSYCVDNLIYVVSIASGTSWETGVRRSTRIRSRPLEYWKGERFLYGRIHGSKSHHTLSCAFQYTRNLFCHDTVLHLVGLY